MATRESGTGVGVVCVHSSASSSGQWRALITRLSSQFHVLADDLYGYGESPSWPADRPLSLADEVALLEPVFRAAGEPFHLVGHSYGGAVALRAAMANPRRLRSLVLIEPVLFALLTAQDPHQPACHEIIGVRNDTTAAVDRGDVLAAAERFVNYWMGPTAWSLIPDRQRTGIANAMPKVKAEWHAVFAEPTPLSAFAQLDVPTLYLVGSDSPSSSRKVADLLIGVLPRVLTVEIDGVGHMGPITHPDIINATIETYLQSTT
jgi:pimeloyl-ACP methyl ester carboxylesterase